LGNQGSQFLTKIEKAKWWWITCFRRSLTPVCRLGFGEHYCWGFHVIFLSIL
jgi:hypothetical protein